MAAIRILWYSHFLLDRKSNVDFVGSECGKRMRKVL